jgi:hypothetical protein
MSVTFNKWLYHVERKWQTPVRNRFELIGFASTIASFGQEGENNYPMNCTLERLGNISRSTVQRLKRECLALGLLEITGKTPGGVPIYSVSIPPDDVYLPGGDPWDQEPWTE